MEFIKGFTANAIAMTATAPFDTIRTNYQTKPTTFSHTVSNINKNYGGYRGFYKGLSSGIATYPVFWGTYFHINKYIKDAQKNIADNSRADTSHINNIIVDISRHKIVANFANSYVSANVASVVSNPLFVIKVRTQTSGISPITAIKNIYNETGIRGFAKGLPITTISNLRLGIMMPAFDAINEKLNNTALSAFLSKSAISTVLYPFDYIRVIQRNSSTKIKSIDILTDFYKKNGIRSLYRGVHLHILATTPQFIIMMCVMSNM